MTATFATVGAWSYGLAAAGFAVFLTLVALGRSLPAQPRTLLAALAASVAWAVAGVGFAVEGSAAWWTGHVLLDLLRVGLWLALLATFFGTAAGAPRSWSLVPRSRWGIPLGALAAFAAVAMWPPRLAVEGAPAGNTAVGGLVALLGLTI